MQVQCGKRRLIPGVQADALFCRRLFRPWEGISEARGMHKLTVLPPLDRAPSSAGETFRCREMYPSVTEVLRVFPLATLNTRGRGDPADRVPGAVPEIAADIAR